MSDRRPDRETGARKRVVVRVTLSDFLSRLAPEKDVRVPVAPGCTVAELMDDLAERLGLEFRQALLDENGRPHPEYAVVLNGRVVPPERLSECAVREDSQLNIIPVAGGG